MSFVDFDKVFFPTDEEKRKAEEFLVELEKQQLKKYMDKGLTKEEAEKAIDEDVKEFINRGYYS